MNPIVICSFDLLLQEKEDIEAEFVEYKREVQLTSKGAAAKEVRILKNMVKNLEEELVEQKAKHQRSSGKIGQEYRTLVEEVYIHVTVYAGSCDNIFVSLWNFGRNS